MNLKSASRKISTAIFAVMMFFMAISTYAQSPEVRAAFRLIDIEQPTKGIAALEKLPSNSGNLYYLGLAQLRMGDKAKALATFEKGIAANEKDGLNYAGKGYVRLLEKNPADAKVQLDKALQVSKSKDINVLKAVAEAYLSDSKYLLDAINALNKAIAINGTDPEAHMLMGDALIMQTPQNAGPAVTSYERAAKADAKYAKPHYKVGKMYQRAKSLDIALTSYEKAIQIDPEYAPAYKELGQVAYSNKQPAKAVEAYEKYMTITEKPDDAKFQLAFFYFMNKQYDKANAIFKEVNTNPNVPAVAYKFEGLSLIQQGKAKEALTSFQNYFTKATPEKITGDDYADYGKVLLEQKTPESDSLASENFAKALAMDTTISADVIQLHGDTYLKRKKFPEAIETFKRLMAERKQPLSQDLWSIGRAYYYNEQFQQADSAFTLLSERQPNMTVGFQYAARARQQIDSTGAQALANPMYEALIEKALANPEKYKKELIEAYTYFGAYYVNVKPDVPKAKTYFEKILQLDPAHKDANEALKVINAPAPKADKGKK